MSHAVSAVLFGLMGGATLGVCMAPLWMMLQLPVRTVDIFDCGTMKQCVVALSIGATLGTLHMEGVLPDAFGIFSMIFSGMFVGMFGAALEEAVEVVPVLFDRLSITADMRFAAAAMALGKTMGALAAGILRL